MATFVLSAETQQLINIALQNGPGINNTNYISAYNSIYGDIRQNASVDPGTAYWFSQAAAVNGNAVTPTAAGTFIRSFTEAAAATQGYFITAQDIQNASNKIASSVFLKLFQSNFVFTDNDSASNSFSPKNIVADDAGAGIGYLKDLYQNISFADWGGTLYAQTVLNDPTYVQDYKLNLTFGSPDCIAIGAGLAGAVLASSSLGFSDPLAAVDAVRNLDGSIIQACSLPYGNFPSFKLDQRGDITSYGVQTAGGQIGSTTIAYNSAGQIVGGTTTYSSTGSTASAVATIVTDASSGLLQTASVSLAGGTGGRSPTTQITFGNGGSADGIKVDYTPAVLTVGTGSGITANVTSSSVSYDVGANATITFNGGGNTVAAGDNNSLTVSGDGNAVSGLVAGDTVGFAGNNNVVTSASGASGGIIGFAGTGETANVNGATIAVGGATSASIFGNHNTVGYFSAGDAIGFSGDYNTITEAQGASGGVVGFDGQTDTANVTGATIDLAGAGTSASVFGSTDTVDRFSAGEYVGLLGNADAVVDQSGASGGWVGLTGQGVTATVNDATVQLGGNTNATLIGNWDTVQGLAAGNVVGVAGNNDVVDETAGATGGTVGFAGQNETENASGTTTFLAGIGSSAALNGSNDALIRFDNNESVNVAGNNDVVADNAGASGGWVGFAGRGEAANVDNTNLTLYANTSASVFGNSDSVGGLAAGSSVGFQGNNDTVWEGQGASGGLVGFTGQGETANTSGSIIFTGDGTGLLVDGNSNGINGLSGGSLTLDGVGNYGNVTGSSIRLGDGSQAALNASDDTAVNGVDGSLTLTGNTNGVTSSSGSVTLNGTGDYGTVDGTTLALGLYSQAALNANYDAVSNGFGATLVLQGNGNGISSYSGNLTLEGTGDFGTVDGTNLTLGADSQAALTANNDITSNGPNSTLTLSGFDNGVNSYSGTVILNGTGDYGTAVNSHVTLEDSSQASLTATSSVINNGMNGTLSVNGNSNDVNSHSGNVTLDGVGNYGIVDGTALTLGANSAASLYANYDNVTAGASATVGLNGTGNRISANSATVTIYGTGNQGSVDGAPVNQGADSQTLSPGSPTSNGGNSSNNPSPPPAPATVETDYQGAPGDPFSSYSDYQYVNGDHERVTFLNNSDDVDEYWNTSQTQTWNGIPWAKVDTILAPGQAGTHYIKNEKILYDNGSWENRAYGDFRVQDNNNASIYTYLIDEQFDGRGNPLGTTAFLDSGGTRQYRDAEFQYVLKQFAGDVAPFSNDGKYAGSLNYGGQGNGAGQNNYQVPPTSAPFAGATSGSGLATTQAGNSSTSGPQGSGSGGGAYVPVFPLGNGDDAFSSYVQPATYGYGSLSGAIDGMPIRDTGSFLIPTYEASAIIVSP